MNFKEEALKLHRDNTGKISVISKVAVKNAEDLSLAYTPGVAEPCKEIAKNSDRVYEYTAKGNLVAVVTDGTAVLGLGDIGPLAALPVMEGKAVLFKAFAGVDAFPICLNTKDIDRIVETIKLLEPTFGGINLEDIAAPACFEIEERLKEEMSIPVFHDDQHGTAIVTTAGLINALKVVNKKLDQIKVFINGAGAAAIAIAKLLLHLKVGDIVMADSRGVIYEGRKEGMNPYKEQIARATNRGRVKGKLVDGIRGADVFIGVSRANVLTAEMIRSMAQAPVIFAMANPVPEILPDEAKAAGAAVIGTGRSDYPNQINNVLAFPGVFRGALDVRAVDITEEMKLAAAYAIADLIPDNELSPNYIIPDPFDKRVAAEVAASVARVAMETGVARAKRDPDEIRRRTVELAKI
ncbi:MAG: NAD-dependent malic enzyme [Firmicutes bacterium]|jgi:malate dehydrogenase (oxaloacetate-decarboxylating)|nr:NAD-dependent malic enzyme [Bacillota bacterium]